MRDILKNWLVEGHFRVAAVNRFSGTGRVLVDKPNAIMYPATAIVARGLVGLANSAISHLYLAYNNNGAYPAGGYAITPSGVTFPKDANTGLLRIPITMPGTVSPAVDGSYQLLNFTVLVSQPNSFVVTGSPSLNSGGVSGSDFFEAALVCQTEANGSPSNTSGDLVFARVAFERLAYDEVFNLTVSWGIKLSS